MKTDTEKRIAEIRELHGEGFCHVDDILFLLSIIHDLRAELEKCRRDARRYLAIRNGCGTDLYPILNEYHEPDEFDQAIDAAISAGEGKE